jgi:hypothetical protein
VFVTFWALLEGFEPRLLSAMANSKVHFDASVDGSFHAWGHDDDRENDVWCNCANLYDVEDDVDDFLLSLKLGTGNHVASLEDTIGTRLRRSEREKQDYKRKIKHWCVFRNPTSVTTMVVHPSSIICVCC